ncbi:hypothetical protein XELAEV_18028939mg [Xenopus laevis]|uniref:Uncharacterized protein n=1 Tax=Xenopus laevis TaxID=8355 RepID=A0A974CR36_XENLA|nr:hypothetical protein XELAEV_18028939mg [Xenopus laevis]
MKGRLSAEVKIPEYRRYRPQTRLNLVGRGGAVFLSSDGIAAQVWGPYMGLPGTYSCDLQHRTPDPATGEPVHWRPALQTMCCTDWELMEACAYTLLDSTRVSNANGLLKLKYGSTLREEHG